eukprot:352986-Chlamydomonas_euryale.AAC.1
MALHAKALAPLLWAEAGCTQYTAPCTLHVRSAQEAMRTQGAAHANSANGHAAICLPSRPSPFPTQIAACMQE